MTVIKQTYTKIQRPNESLNKNGNYSSFCGFLFHFCSAYIKITLMMLLKSYRFLQKTGSVCLKAAILNPAVRAKLPCFKMVASATNKSDCGTSATNSSSGEASKQFMFNLGIWTVSLTFDYIWISKLNNLKSIKLTTALYLASDITTPSASLSVVSHQQLIRSPDKAQRQLSPDWLNAGAFYIWISQSAQAYHASQLRPTAQLFCRSF